jgi:hypothetical protein
VRGFAERDLTPLRANFVGLLCWKFLGNWASSGHKSILQKTCAGPIMCATFGTCDAFVVLSEIRSSARNLVGKIWSEAL